MMTSLHLSHVGRSSKHDLHLYKNRDKERDRGTVDAKFGILPYRNLAFFLGIWDSEIPKMDPELASFLEPPPTIRGEDGVLRCSRALKPLPELDGSIARYLMQKLQAEFDQGINNTFLVDGKKGEFSCCHI